MLESAGDGGDGFIREAVAARMYGRESVRD